MQATYALKGSSVTLKTNEFSYIQLDILKELTNIGGGNAATSISHLIDKPINMTVPTIEILNYNEIFERIMPEDKMVTAVVMRMLGGGEGTFLFVIDEEASFDLIHMMVSNGIEIDDELANSCIKELVNIVVTSFLNAVSKMIDISFISSIPLLTKDMFGAILSSVYIESEQYDDNVLIIKNEFIYQGDKIEAQLYFIPKPGVLTKLFNKLGF